MSESGIQDFDYAVYLLRLFVRLKKYILHDEVLLLHKQQQQQQQRQGCAPFHEWRGQNYYEAETSQIVKQSTTILKQNGQSEKYDLTFPHYHKQLQPGDEPPRALKKRTKKVRTDRRSKSVEHRRKRRDSLHKSIPKSKDDLDFGTYTVIGRPPNPWDQENSLKRGKSLPNFNGDLGSLNAANGFSVSTPNSNDFEELTGVSPVASESPTHLPEPSSPSCLKENITSNHTINISNDDNSATRESNETPSSSDEPLGAVNFKIKTPKQRFFVTSRKNSTTDQQQEVDLASIRSNEGSEPNEPFSTLSELDVGELKRHFRECVITVTTTISEETGQEENELVLKTHAKDLHQAKELKKSFEHILESLGNVTEDFKLTPHVRKTSLASEATISHQRLLFNQQHQEIFRRTRTRITVKHTSYRKETGDLFEYSITIFNDFLDQLVASSSTHTTEGDENNNDNEASAITDTGQQKYIEDEETVDGFRTMIGVQGNSMSINDSTSDEASSPRSASPSITINQTDNKVSPVIQPPTPDESRTFNFYYTIDAEISHTEYKKIVKIVHILREQKKRWDEKMSETHDQLDKSNKEKTQLTNNNHILRESLEAANKAIKEINGKVHELKETLVPLRNENTALREENDELKQNIENVNLENALLTKDSENVQKLKQVYEEKTKVKEQETEDFKNDMHDKFKKLEELYRNYQLDMEKRNTGMIGEAEELTKIHEAMRSEIEVLNKENNNFKKQTETLQESNQRLGAELRKKKTVDAALHLTSKVKEKLSENAQEIENFYKKEVEELNKVLNKTRNEVEKHREEARSLEQANIILKQNVEGLESQLRILENRNEEILTGKTAGGQQVEFLEKQVETLKKENKLLDESIKQDKFDTELNQQHHVNQVEELETKLRKFDSLKREQFSQGNENQRMKSEIAQLKSDLEDHEQIKRQSVNERFENERLKSELQHLQKQLKLVEDQQKLAQGPYSAELKSELQNIRNQMRDLASSNQDKRLELYTNELKGELASLKDQIKELDVGTKQATNIQYSSTTNQVSNETYSSSIVTGQVVNHDRVSSSASSEKSTQSNLSKREKNDVVKKPYQNARLSRDEDNVHANAADDEVFTDTPRRRSTGDINRIYVSKSSEISRQEKNSESDKLKQIEDRIRRKREKNTDWSLRTPSIDKMRRKSFDELTTMSLYGEDTSARNLRRRERSLSIGRSKSADPSSFQQQTPRVHHPEAVVRPVRRERGRSPHRRDRGSEKVEYHSDTRGDRKELDSAGFYRPYEVDITVDNSQVRRVNSRSMMQLSAANSYIDYEGVFPGQPKQLRGYESADAHQREQHTRTAESAEQYRTRPRSEERGRGGERIRKRFSSSMHVDESSSDDYEYHHQRNGYRSIDYRHPVTSRRQNSAHNTDEMLTQAMRSRQYAASSNTQRVHAHSSYILPMNGSDKQRYRSTGELLGNYVAEKINKVKLNNQQESPLHLPKGFEHQREFLNESGRGRGHGAEFRRHTAPSKEMRGMIETRNQTHPTQEMLDSRTREGSLSALNEKKIQSIKKEQMINTIKAEQALKLTLVPTNVIRGEGGRDTKQVKSQPPSPRHNNQHQQHHLIADPSTATATATATRKYPSSSKQQNKLTKEELAHQERMEKARQKMLRKIQQSPENQKQQLGPAGGAVTRSGLPMQRSRNGANDIPSDQESTVRGHRNKPAGNEQNKFISQQEASRHFTSRRLEKDDGSFRRNTYDNRHDTDCSHHQTSMNTRTNTWGHRDRDRDRDDDEQHVLLSQNSEQFQSFKNKSDSLPKDMKPTSKKNRDGGGGGKGFVHTTSKETRDKERQRRVSEDEQISRSRRAISNENNDSNTKNGRPKSAGNVRSPKAFSDVNDRSSTGKQRVKKSEPAPPLKKTESYHCDICQKLNKNKRAGEPTRYCWERYHAVSSSTPK